MAMIKNAGSFFSNDGNMNPAGGPYNTAIPIGGPRVNTSSSIGGGGALSAMAGPFNTMRIPPTSEIARGAQPNYASEIRPLSGVKSVDEGSDIPVHYNLCAKPWDDTNGSLTKGTFDDITTELPHHLQLQMGDLVFTARMINTNTREQNRITMAEMAKLNDILAQEGAKLIRDTLERPLCRMDGYQQRYTNGEYADPIVKTAYPNDIAKKKIWNLMADLYWIDAVLTDGKLPEEIYEWLKNGGSKPYNFSTNKQHLFYPSEYSLVKYRTWKEAGGKDHAETNLKPPADMSLEDWTKNYNAETNDSLWEPESDDILNNIGSIADLKRLLVDSIKKPDQETIDENTLHKLYLHFNAFRHALVEILATNNQYFNHCTRSGIISNWNFFGVVNNDGGEGTLNSGGRPKSMAPEINFVVRRIAQVTNRWAPELVIGTSLSIILKRYGKGNHFQMVPHYNMEGEEPAWEDRVFTDLDGTQKEGHVYPVGVVYYDVANDGVADSDREIANGLAKNGNPINFAVALEKKINIAKEKKLWIQVRE